MFVRLCRASSGCSCICVCTPVFYVTAVAKSICICVGTCVFCVNAVLQSICWLYLYLCLYLCILCYCSLVLATFKNLPAERVPSECNESRYIADIFIKDIFFPVPIYCRYIVSPHCSEHPSARKSFPQSCCQCRGWLRIGCWILFYGMS